MHLPRAGAAGVADIKLERPAAAILAVAAAHEAACDLLGVLGRLDSLMTRPQLPLILRLLATSPGLSPRPAHSTASGADHTNAEVDGGACAVALQLSLLTTCAAERQLPMLVRLVSMQVCFPAHAGFYSAYSQQHCSYFSDACNDQRDIATGL